MLRLVAERAGHAAAAGVEHRHVQTRHQPQRRRRAAMRRPAPSDGSGRATRTSPACRPSSSVQATGLDLLRQPAVGQVGGRRPPAAHSAPAPVPATRRPSVSRQLGSRPRIGVPSATRCARPRQLRRGPGCAPRRRKPLRDHRPAAAGQAGQFDAIAGPLQHAHRRPADLRLVERREAVVEQDAPGRRLPAFGVRLVPAEPAAEMVGVQRRQATGGGRCRPSSPSAGEPTCSGPSQLTSGASGAPSRLSRWMLAIK